jgi:ketosteroid isomerase-like protein
VSQENVEIVRDAHKALNGGNIDALIRLCDPAFRLDMSDRVFNPVIYEGHDGIRRFYSQVWDVWENVTWEPEKLLESSDRVLALLRESARGRGSGIEVKRRTAMLWTFRGDRLTSLRFFRDRTEALEAAGLRDG